MNPAVPVVRILIVDDDEDATVLLRDYIREGLRDCLPEIDSCRSFGEAVTVIGGKSYDIYIVDYLLNHINGIELIQEIKKDGFTPPVIFLTGYGNEDIAVAAMKAGAADYLPKAKLSPELICSSLRYALEVYRREKLRKEAEEALLASEQKLRLKQRELEELNRTLEERVTKEVSLSREKDRVMLIQGRQAAMGEMINNIAHQWRQPLNAVGLIIQSMQDMYDYGELNRESLDRSVTQCMDIINHMSQTIDDFRNFFRPDKEKREFNLKEVVSKAVSFVAASFRSNNIRLETDIDHYVVITGYANEYSQVLLNILNNAKDVFLDRGVRDACVKIRLFREGERSVVTITDNAGGIAEDLAARVFEPYFTTREQGTGIGLYMSKIIIEKNMGGRIAVRNVNGGAEFRVEV